jgi:glycerol-3-phosphate dehydrogenase (NAD(P)+)
VRLLGYAHGMIPNVAIIGNGSWATALVQLVTATGHPVRWWVRTPEDVEVIRATGSNPSYLSEVQLPLDQLTVSADVAEVIAGAQIVLFVVPSAYLAGSIEGLPKSAFAGRMVASAIKGLEITTGLRIADFFAQQYGIPASRYAAVSGPSHAEEVARGQITYLTVASENEYTARAVADVLRGPNLRTVIADDVLGVELAAIMKNIYAVCVGMAIGLGYGDNFIAVLTTNCLREMDAFLHGLAPGKRNIAESAYLGDLLVTAYSQHSRNRQLGQLVGQGLSAEQAMRQMRMVAEGYYASRLVEQQAYAGSLPIAHAVFSVLHAGASPSEVITALLPSFR